MKKIILGTVQFGMPYGINNNTGQIPETEINDILDYAFENKIESLDTAPAYGRSEELLGRYFEKNRDKSFRIITKLDLKNNPSCEASLLKSIQHIRMSSIDTLLFHSYKDYEVHRDEVADLCKKYKGREFRKIGVSVYTNEEISNLITDPAVDVVQAPFNLLDNEQQRGYLFRKVKQAGKEVHTRSVFLQGLFFKPLDHFPPFLESLKTSVQQLHHLAGENGLDIRDLALSYALSKSYIDGVLFGVDSLGQLKQNIAVKERSLSKELGLVIDGICIKEKHLLNPSTWPGDQPVNSSLQS